MEKNHCCANCLEPASEEYFFQLKLRKVYFCCQTCKSAWEKAKEVFLKEKKGKE